MQDPNTLLLNKIIKYFYDNQAWGEILLKIKNGEIYLIEKSEQIKTN